MDSLKLYTSEHEQREIVQEVRRHDDVVKPEDAVRYVAEILQVNPVEALRIAQTCWVNPAQLVSN